MVIAGVQEELKTNVLFISPNPTNGIFKVQWMMDNGNTSTISHQALTIEIYNAMGQEVREMNNISGQSITLQRDNLPGGLYFIRLMQEGKIMAIDKLVITDN